MVNGAKSDDAFPLTFLTKRFAGYVLTPSLTCSSENRTPEVALWKETERNLIYATPGIYTVRVSVLGSFCLVGTGKPRITVENLSLQNSKD